MVGGRQFFETANLLCETALHMRAACPSAHDIRNGRSRFLKSNRNKFQGAYCNMMQASFSGANRLKKSD